MADLDTDIGTAKRNRRALVRGWRARPEADPAAEAELGFAGRETVDIPAAGGASMSL
jgi:hypothetical protein